MSRPPGLTIILFAFPDLTVGARLCRAFGALGNADPSGIFGERKREMKSVVQQETKQELILPQNSKWA